MKKFTKSESVEVLSPAEHQEVEDQLHKLGKTSARELTDKERDDLTSRLDELQ